MCAHTCLVIVLIVYNKVKLYVKSTAYNIRCFLCNFIIFFHPGTSLSSTEHQQNEQLHTYIHFLCSYNCSQIWNDAQHGLNVFRACASNVHIFTINLFRTQWHSSSWSRRNSRSSSCSCRSATGTGRESRGEAEQQEGPGHVFARRQQTLQRWATHIAAAAAAALRVTEGAAGRAEGGVFGSCQLQRGMFTRVLRR